jgi:hypothetical protein
MSRFAKGFVSALLPAVAIALVHGCGGGGSNETAQTDTPPQSPGTTPAPAPAPAAASNRAPTINRVGDEYARVGETYSFQPAAVDADGDPLRFTATNLPPWASIDPDDGRITGTPGVSDEGVYESIVIMVADASHKIESAPFSITVMSEVASGVATLRWEAPPSKLDGAPLDDLAGYRILYGRSADNLDQSVLIDDPAITSYEFTALQKGLWYFAVVAVNSGGLEGPPTVVMTKSI